MDHATTPLHCGGCGCQLTSAYAIAKGRCGSCPDRRKPEDAAAPKRRGVPLPGGSRADDPPLTVSEFATWTGYSQEVVRRAIRGGDLVALNMPGPGGKPNYRLELADCIAFLKQRRYSAERIALLEQLLAKQCHA